MKSKGMYSDALRNAVRKSKSASENYLMVLIFSVDGQYIDCIPKSDFDYGCFNNAVYTCSWGIDYPLTLREAAEIINSMI